MYKSFEAENFIHYFTRKKKKKEGSFQSLPLLFGLEE